jgi:hypothetical protein
MEFQNRGACHFHLLVDKEIDEDELKRIWYEIVGSGDSRHRNRGAHIAPIRKVESFKKYLSAYLTKEEQKTIPYFYSNAGRFWGYSRSLITVKIAIIVGPKSEIKKIRRNFRIFRRWQKARYRQWNKGPISTKKMKNINPYVFVLPGEYMFFTEAKKLIDAVKGTPYDDELFEDWGSAGA